MRTSAVTRWLTFTIAAGVVGAVSVLAPTVAQGDGVATVDIGAQLSRQGVLTVAQNFTGDATGSVTISERIPTRVDRGEQRFNFEVTDITISQDGRDLPVNRTEMDGYIELTFESQPSSVTTVGYVVSGATSTTVDGRVAVTWLLLDSVNVDIDQVSGELDVPAGAVSYDCSTGVVGALVTCSTYSGGTHGDTRLTFTQNSLLAGESIQAEVVFPAGHVDVTQHVAPVWSLGRAIGLGGGQIAAMAAVLLLGAALLFGLWRWLSPNRSGRQPISLASFETDNQSLHFHPGPHARPGMVGTIVDGRVDPADVVATILDLAARGHLVVTEVSQAERRVPDWVFSPGKATEELAGYERALVEMLTSQNTSVSHFGDGLAPTIAAIQQDLYGEVVRAGWFARVPSKSSPAVVWGWIGLAASVVITGLLIWLTTYGLAGFACVAVAVVALAAAYRVPAITADGTAVRAGLATLSDQLHTVDPGRIPASLRYAEISRVLPYAVVLGGWDRWTAAMVASDDDVASDSADLAWYQAPSGWTMADLPASLDAFITVVTGRLFARS